jgi:hypothetical protein
MADYKAGSIEHTHSMYIKLGNIILLQRKNQTVLNTARELL